MAKTNVAVAVALPNEALATTETNVKKPLRCLGGTYFYSSSICGHKNVFVTPEYLNLLVGAFKKAEIQHDIKNLAYVIMPNHFCWLFRLNAQQDDPVKIYADMKKNITLDILKNLSAESKEGATQYPLLEVFKNNNLVKRSNPRKIIWTFREAAKNDPKGERKYQVWDKKAMLKRIDDEETLLRNARYIIDSPSRERWKLVEDSFDYPYLFVSEEILNKVSA
jgi:REP element-mobilizing transposase RayT